MTAADLFYRDNARLRVRAREPQSKVGISRAGKADVLTRPCAREAVAKVAKSAEVPA
jgi:hypothetical protein